MATPVTKFQIKQASLLRDPRPLYTKAAEYFGKFDTLGGFLIGFALMIAVLPLVQAKYFMWVLNSADVILLFGLWYYRWADKREFKLPLKIPAYAGDAIKDPRNSPPGKSGPGKCEGILYIGTDQENGQEIWVTNNDSRTHFLYLGTTGSGKTEGLKSMVTNSLTWGSGYVYVDGKADTDLWASLYSMARRFGRDDDVLILNYMTGNSDDAAVSNTMNPFANGSSSYLSNMVVSLMPDAGGDNAMWKERAVALMFALMPALTWKRDHQGLLLDISVVREHLELKPIIRLSRDPNLPERIIRGLQGYLSTLPGYVDAAFDDEGNERPPSPDQPMYDLQVARQQHGYLSMQFTRSLQSLADEYGYIFKAQLADIDVMDVVLNRRILVVLIPALEKSGDEAANLGKIVAACLKGMMGATLGSTVEGTWEEAIGTKQTRSNSGFMTVFDEVGYYTAQGMAVMAAQARSLGFSLVFAAQDLPAMEKRVKQEARSILGNCNIKIFGKLEDPLDTKEFLNKHAGDEWVMETKGMTAPTNTVASLFSSDAYMDDRSVGLNVRQRVSYDHLRKQREGEAYIFWQEILIRARMFHAQAERPKAMRVHRLLPVPGTTTLSGAREKNIQELALQLKDPDWTAENAVPALGPPPAELAAMQLALRSSAAAGKTGLESGTMALASLLDMSQQHQAATIKAEQERLMLGRPKVQIATSHPMQAGDEYRVADVITGGHFGIPGTGGGGVVAQVAPQVRAAIAHQPLAGTSPMDHGGGIAAPVGVAADIGAPPMHTGGGDGMGSGDGGNWAAPAHTMLGSRAGDLAVMTRRPITIDNTELQLPPDVESALQERAARLRARLLGERR